MPILAWTFSGKNTSILTKSKTLIFVSYTLQVVIAISALHHGLISFLLKVKVNPNHEENWLEESSLHFFLFIVFVQNFQVGNAILQSCEKDFLYLNVRGYWNSKKYKITEVWYKAWPMVLKNSFMFETSIEHNRYDKTEQRKLQFK